MSGKSDKKKPLVPSLRFPEFREAGAWEVKRLGEVANISMGASPKSASYNDQRIGLPLIQGNADIKDRKSSPRLFASQITRECWVGDILVGVRAPVGMVAKSEHHACIGRGISALCVKGEDRQEFLYQWLLWYEPHWVSISQGGTFDSVNKNEITNLVALFPNPSEQQKVAHCLSSLDEVIGLQAKKVQALKQHKKGLMQQLFPAEGETTPRLRFPDFREAGAWEVKRLAEIGEIVTGTTPSTKKAEYYEDGIHLWVTPTDIGEEKDITETKIKLSEEGLQAGRFVPRNSLLVTCIASIGKNAILRMDGSCNQQINAITRFQGACVDFLYYLIERNTPVLLNTAGQGGMAILNKNDFSNLRFPFPALREQQKIAHCLSSLDDVIGLESHKLDALKNLKKGLMQQLFPQDVA